jgi:hypothetical protein
LGTWCALKGAILGATSSAADSSSSRTVVVEAEFGIFPPRVRHPFRTFGRWLLSKVRRRGSN